MKKIKKKDIYELQKKISRGLSKDINAKFFVGYKHNSIYEIRQGVWIT